MGLVPVQLSIPRPYNGGEWRVSKQVVGPRGGKHWETIISQPATGGEYRTQLAVGSYKETWWTNGWPSSSTFEIVKAGVSTDVDGSKYQVYKLIEDESEIEIPVALEAGEEGLDEREVSLTISQHHLNAENSTIHDEYPDKNYRAYDDE